MWVIGHRGASGYAPENTLASFQLAVEMGAKFVETDLHLSRDARLVALHDEALDRTTNGHGPVSGKTLEELKQLDAGAWFFKNSSPSHLSAREETKQRTFAGQRIPTVEEVLTFGRDQDIGLYLELKPSGPSGVEHATVGALRAAGEIVRSVVVLCFDLSTLLRLRQLDPMVVTGYLCEQEATIKDASARAVKVGARQLLPREDFITPEFLAEAHKKDLKVVAWTVNDAARMMQLMDAGVDGIITDYPDKLAALLPRG